MKQILTVALILSSLSIAACAKKAEQGESKEAESNATTQNAAPPAAEAPQASNTEPSEEGRERQKKMALLDYATMENNYLQDTHAQWAASAKASSTFGDEDGDPSSSSVASNVVGAVDGKTWTNNHQDIGFDWLETTYAKPVSATEVRVVFSGGDGVEAVNKVELQDTQGGWHTVWSGLSDVKQDRRGNRTWFVRTFDKTGYQANAVKITIANNVQSGYKVVDAVQLVGE